jgi:hypothetical protein
MPRLAPAGGLARAVTLLTLIIACEVEPTSAAAQRDMYEGA